MFSALPLVSARTSRAGSALARRAPAAALDPAPLLEMYKNAIVAPAHVKKASSTAFISGWQMERDESRGVWKFAEPGMSAPLQPLVAEGVMVHTGVAWEKDEALGVWRAMA